MKEELEKIEGLLTASEERYRRLFETARDGILILNSENGAIEDVNPFLEQLLGYSKKEFLGKKLWEVGAFKNIKASKETFKIVQEMGYVRYEDLPLEAKDGRLIDVEFISNAYMAGNERVIQCNIRDISERKRIEMTDKTVEFLKQEKQKTSFIADVTHELRTPLAIIKGNVELALRDKKTVQVETFKIINTEINHLAAMLSDLTILTTESRSLNERFSKHSIDISDCISRLVERFKIIALPKNITIKLEKMPQVHITGDINYIEKLFSNIINNAIFYGKENGNVLISGKKDKKNILISITDDGIGIAKEDIANIFERFYRTRSGRDANHSGTGLGLAISKWITEAHGGEITVTSTVNKGTTFTITLPLV